METFPTQHITTLTESLPESRNTRCCVGSGWVCCRVVYSTRFRTGTSSSSQCLFTKRHEREHPEQRQKWSRFWTWTGSEMSVSEREERTRKTEQAAIVAFDHQRETNTRKQYKLHLRTSVKKQTGTGLVHRLILEQFSDICPWRATRENIQSRKTLE